MNTELCSMSLKENQEAVLAGELDYLILGGQQPISELVAAYKNVKKNAPKDKHLIALEKDLLYEAINMHHQAEITSAFANGQVISPRVLVDYPELVGISKIRGETKQTSNTRRGY